MNKKVKVTTDAAGNVVVVSQNPEFGYIRVEQRRLMMDENGWVRPRTVSALIHGRVDVLHEYGWKKGQEIDGKVLIKESLTPFNKKEPDRDAKVAGKTGIVCTYQGAPIYRFHTWDETGKKEDELIQHDNIDAIREAFQKLEEAGGGEGEENGGSLTNPK
jgi:hypothetical protein